MALVHKKPQDTKTLALPFGESTAARPPIAPAANDNAAAELARRREQERAEDAEELGRLHTPPSPDQVRAFFRRGRRH